MSQDHRDGPLPAPVRYGLVRARLGVADGHQITRPVLQNDLIRYVEGTSTEADRIEAAIETDPALRDRYLDLLERFAHLTAPRLRAAATDTVSTSRRGEGFRLTWVRPAAVSDQVYVVLELEPPARYPDGAALTVHVCTGGRATSRRFPPLADGRSQLILAPQDKLLALLAAGDSRVLIV